MEKLSIRTLYGDETNTFKVLLTIWRIRKNSSPIQALAASGRHRPLELHYVAVRIAHVDRGAAAERAVAPPCIDDGDVVRRQMGADRVKKRVRFLTVPRRHLDREVVHVAALVARAGAAHASERAVERHEI